MFLDRIETFVATAIDKKSKRRKDNIIEATYLANFLKKLMGTSVFYHDITVDYVVVRRFSSLGFVSFICLVGLYSYCAYTSFTKKQSIIQDSYFKSKLQHYGDFFEWIIATAYTAYSMYKLPFSINGNVPYVQIVIDIDLILKKMGEIINYVPQARLVFCFGLLQVTMITLHWVSLYLCIFYVKKDMPHELIVQVTISDAMALVITTHYCYYLNLLKIRYKLLNKRLHKLGKIKRQYARDKEICRDIRNCGKIYDLMFKATIAADQVFGLALVITILTNVLYMIINLFYCMEAHVQNIFTKNFNKYLVLMIHIIWEIFYCLLIIIMNIYYCEHAMQEAKETGPILHEIINNHISSAVSRKAMQFSQQLLHQSPRFSASGLFRLEYVLLLQGGRAMATFMLILLQFASN